MSLNSMLAIDWSMKSSLWGAVTMMKSICRPQKEWAIESRCFCEAPKDSYRRAATVDGPSSTGPYQA